MSTGTHVIDVGDNTAAIADAIELSINAVISGPVLSGITKEGTGDLLLSGNNTFGGQVIVNAGTIWVNHSAALGDGGTIGSTTVNDRASLGVVFGVAVGNEVLRLNSAGNSSREPALRASGIASWSGDIVLLRDTSIGSAPTGDFTLTGVISGTGNIAKENTGLLRIAGNSADNTFDGDLLLNAGTVELDKGTIGGLVAVPGRLIIGDGEGGVHADVARLRKDNQVSQVTVNGSGLWDLGVFDDEVSDLVLNEGGDVTTEATGRVRLGINADVTVTPARVNDTGVLRVFGNGTTSGEPLILDTSGLNSINPVALIVAGERLWTGNLTLLRDSTISVSVSGSFEVSGVISGAGGLTKFSQGPLTFSGNSANTYSGVTTVKEGRLVLNKAGVNVAVPGRLIIGDDIGGANADVVECLSVNEIGAPAVVTVNSSGQLIARQEQFDNLTGSGNVSVSSSLNAGSDGGFTTFSGVISGAGAFNKTGAGTLQFTGNNTYAGGTGIAEGTLLINGQQPSSVVLIQPDGALGGIGRVGNVSMFAGGAEVLPGNSPGRLTTANLQLAADAIYTIELDGPIAGTQHDQVRVFGTVNLGGANLRATLTFIPTLGEPIIIIDNDGTDVVIDQFNGLAEGDTIRLNQVPFVISYEGGDGNDVTLTATNTSISVVSTRVEAGNGNSVIDPNECNHLFVALMNETGGPLVVSRVVLDSATPGVVVTQQRSEYANFGALDIRTNRVPFQFRTAPDFECGRIIEFLLTITVTGGGGGTFAIPFRVPSGGAGTPVEFNNGVNQALVDQGQFVSTLNVSGAAPLVSKVTISLHITHPSAGDLVLRLRSPSGTIVNLAANLGGTTDNYGGGCGNQANRTTFDDDAPIRIAAGTAPFIGSFTPDAPLAAFRGEDPNGDWQLAISDTVAGDTGELRCWSLLISPPDCGEGGGQCESCVPSLTGRFNADMPSTTLQFARNGVASGCGSEKVCPTVITGPRLFYRVLLITNSGPATCVSAVLADLCRASNLRLHAAAYLNNYDPAQPCFNYLGDTGSELTASSTSFSFAAPENAVIAIVVSSPVAATACVGGYLVQLHGLPCPPPTLHIAKTGYPDEVRLYWSTAYPDFDLQRTPNLNGAAPYPFANVPLMPFVVKGDYSVTNSTDGSKAFFRLRKP